MGENSAPTDAGGDPEPDPLWLLEHQQAIRLLASAIRILAARALRNSAPSLVRTVSNLTHEAVAAIDQGRGDERPRSGPEDVGNLVLAQACPDCEGGMQWSRRQPPWLHIEPIGRTCPSCGGTGLTQRTKPKREHLRILKPVPPQHFGADVWVPHPVSDNELAEMGFFEIDETDRSFLGKYHQLISRRPVPLSPEDKGLAAFIERVTAALNEVMAPEGQTEATTATGRDMLRMMEPSLPGESGNEVYLPRPVSDEKLAEMGYVKGNLEPLGSSPAEGGGVEFYFAAWGEGEDEHTSFVAEPWMLEDQGWAKTDGIADLAMERDQAEAYVDELLSGGDEFKRLAEKHGYAKLSEVQDWNLPL